LALALVAGALVLAGCDSDSGMGEADDPDNGAGTEVDVTITIDNIGSSAYEVTDVSGASGVAPTGTENPALTLSVGTRYRIDNNGGIGAHPFGFQNGADEYLLRQESEEAGSLEGDEDIGYREDDEGITFTYTQALADAIDAYRCTFHPAMEGDVQSGN
jgi:hypothetical protein